MSKVSTMIKTIQEDANKEIEKINAAADQTYTVEKAKILSELGDKARKEHETHMKKIDTQRMIARSTQINKARLQKVQERSMYLEKAVETVRNGLMAMSKDRPKYKELLTKLIAQGCLKLLETEVVVRCREVDKPLVKEVIQQAEQLYAQVVKKETGKDLKVKLTIDTKALPPPPDKNVLVSCVGGVILFCHQGLISVDNTLDTRLKLVIDQDKPAIRATLFPN